MTIDTIKAKLEQTRKEHAEAKAQAERLSKAMERQVAVVNTIGGAIQVLEELLADEKIPEPAAETKGA